MKIALLTDTHWGVRNDNAIFLDNTKKFLDNVFFPYLELEGINTIIHLGDLVDRRKYININTARRLREDFIQPIHEKGIKMYVIAGNHDTYYKNTNGVNSLRELIGDRYPKIHIFDEKPVQLDLGYGIHPHLFLIPWICDENREITMEYIRKTSAPIALGHLEIKGFEMFKGSVCTHGEDIGLFDKFDMVCSGHFHHKSSSGNIHYLGSHSEFTWSDYNDARGFHVLDLETRDLGFIKNPYTVFDKIWYNDSSMTAEALGKMNFYQYKDKIIKVIVQEKSNPYLFDVFMSSLEKAMPHQVQVVEDHLNLNVEDDGEIVAEAEDTITIFKKYIGQINTAKIDKVRLERTITEIYNEALSVE